MNIQLGKNAESVLHHGVGSFPRRERGTVLRDQPNYGAKQLGRKELIRETQRIMLRFSIKEASHLQDTTERAVEQQRNGESAISLLAVANMCQGSPKARALFAPLFGFTGRYTDPEFMEWQEKMMQEYLHQQISQPEQDNEDEIEHGDLFGGAE